MPFAPACIICDGQKLAQTGAHAIHTRNAARSMPHLRTALLPEQLAPMLVVGHDSLYYGIERGTVIHAYEVRQLMHDNVVYGLVGIVHEPP